MLIEFRFQLDLTGEDEADKVLDALQITLAGLHTTPTNMGYIVQSDDEDAELEDFDDE